MDIGKVVEVGVRTVPGYVPGPTMVPVLPERGDTPEPRREVVTPERETVPAE